MVSLAEGVYWVGAIDRERRDFHGFLTGRGTTYNAYLIVDEKVALIDTVNAGFYPQMRARIAEVIDPARIDYIIANHVEPDHSGSLGDIIAEAPRAQLLATEAGASGLNKSYLASWPFTVVKEGDQLSLGQRTLRFQPIPMLHWPDSMATFLVEEAILFPNDLFGQHLAGVERFDDEAELATVMEEVERYYASIFAPHAVPLSRNLPKLEALAPKVIAPSHGVVWRSHLPEVMTRHRAWAQWEAQPRALLVYDTMWGATQKMAQALAEGLLQSGVEVKMHRLSASHPTDVFADFLEAKALVVGSSTLHNGILPSVAAFLSYLGGLKPRGKLGAAFGSYGWGGGAQRLLQQELDQAGLEVVESHLAVKFTPDDGELEACRQFGRTLGERIKG